MPYFEPLFNGSFACIDSFKEDGIDAETFKKLIRFAYSGTFVDLYSEHNSAVQHSEIKSEVEEDMDLLMAASRFGFSQLVQVCEKNIVSHLKIFPEYASDVCEFANAFNFSNLELLCKTFIARNKV
jgi:hypothetical protein